MKRGKINLIFRILFINDLSPGYPQIFEITYPQEHRSLVKKGLQFAIGVQFELYNQDGVFIAAMVFQAELKLEIIINSDNPEEPIIILTGNFNEQKFVVVSKKATSRKQKLVGECRGKIQQKKLLGFDTTYNATMLLERDYSYSIPIIAGLFLVGAIGSV